MTAMDVSVHVRLGDKISAPLRAVSASLSAKLNSLQATMNRVTAGTKKMTEGLKDVAKRSKTGALALGGYAAAMAGLGLKFIGPAAQMERFNVQLTNLEGSQAGAKKAMAWISDFATRTPLEMNDTVAAYARLKAFGLDPTNGSLQALVDTMAATGGGAEQLDGLVLALGQSWTKGKLQGEEAMQMLERGVPVWDLLAKKLGKTTAEVQEMATAGELGREEIMLLIDALGKANKGASEGMSKTWDGIISNLMDHWTRFQVMVMDSGVFADLKQRLQNFLSLLNRMSADGRLQLWADRLGARILEVIDALWRFGQGLIATWKAVFPWLEAGATAVGGWENFLKIVGGGAVVQKLFGLGGAIGFVGKALLFMGRAALANPVIALITAVAVGAYLIYRYWDQIAAWFVALWAKVTAAFGAARDWIAATLERITPAPLKAAWSILSDYYRNLWEAIKGYFGGMLEFVKGIFTGDMSRATAGLTQMWDSVKAALSAVFEAIGRMMQLVWTSVIRPVLDKFGMTDSITAAWTGLQSALGSVLDWIGSKFTWLWDKISPVIDALRWVKDKGAAALGSLGLGGGDAGGGAMPATDATGAPQGFAKGGDFPAGPIIVGEEGPELRYESRGGFIAHNRALRQMARLSSLARGFGQGQAGQGLAAIPAGPGGRGMTVAPTYQISLTVGPGHGSPAELEAMLRRLLAEQAARAAADVRRALHD